MSATDVQYILQLHRDGVINNEQLRKMVDALNPSPPEAKTETSSALENLRKRPTQQEKEKEGTTEICKITTRCHK